MKWPALSFSWSLIAVISAAPLAAQQAPGSTALLDGNRVLCGYSNFGSICGHLGGPYAGSGFWPGGPNQYIFNSGLQIAGIVAADAGVPWAGDTVGAFCFDPRGTTEHCYGKVDIYLSDEPTHIADWPSAGLVRNTDVFHPSLVGLPSVSNLDTWSRSWDGDGGTIHGPTAQYSRRQYPLGVVVDQRTMQFLDPNGNEDILYLVFDIYNVTASDPAAYAALDPVVQADMAEAGRMLHENVAAVTGDDMPAGGYRIDDLFVALNADPDVGNAGTNSSTIILPFDMAVAYKSDFFEPSWIYPPDINVTPLARRPGLVGFQLLSARPHPRTNRPSPLSLFSNIVQSGTQFPSAVGTSQLWRQLSGNLDRRDRRCQQYSDNRLCFLFPNPHDTKFFQSSGPFSLGPGEKLTFVMAYVFAAPVEAPLPTGGAYMAPGIPASESDLVTNPALVRDIERAAGWISAGDANGNGRVDPPEVETVTRSLLHKAQIARAMLENGFLLPTPPEPPPFYLVPGDEDVTVIWEPSPTEQTGDPYYAIASDPTSPLFDPNFRRSDVEGYLIYRAAPGEEMRLIASFDYEDTTFRDYTGAWVYGGECAPELGPGHDGALGECPVDFSTGLPVPAAPWVDHPLSGVVTQVRFPGRVASVSGGVSLIPGRLDTAAVDLQTYREVPFIFVDNEVEAGKRYVYTVTAFDINSVNSGPSSLESAARLRVADVRTTASNEVLPTISYFISGDDGVPLEPRPMPGIDQETGIFSGPMPPTNAFSFELERVVERLLPAIDLVVRIDSVIAVASSAITSGAQEYPSPECPRVPGTSYAASSFGACWRTWYSVWRDGTFVSNGMVAGFTPWWRSFGKPRSVEVEFPSIAVPLDGESLDLFGVRPSFTATAAIDVTTVEALNHSASQGAQARRYYNYHGGSRWFDGDTEAGDNNANPDPTRYVRVGQVPGVNNIFGVISYTPLAAGQRTPDRGNAYEKACWDRGLAFLGRQADVRFTWENGTFGEVRDVTHNVNVRFSPTVGATWGFLNTDANGNGVLDWQDFNYIDGAHQILRNVDGGSCDASNNSRWDPAGLLATVALEPSAVLVPTSSQGLDTPFGGTTFSATGLGFGLYVNGERYIFEVYALGQTGTLLPATGVTWTLRTYSGRVDAQGYSDRFSQNPSDYTYGPPATGFGSTPLPALIEGLEFHVDIEQATSLLAAGDSLLEKIHTVPDPYYVPDESVEPARLRFVHLPERANIRIYSASGILVKVIDHMVRGVGGNGGEATWNMLTRNNSRVASGVYFWHVETPEGLTRVGRFTIVNGSGVRGFGPAR